MSWESTKAAALKYLAKKHATKRRATKKKTRKKTTRRKKQNPPALTKAQSRDRIAHLRAQGYTVKKYRMPDGTIVVTKSKKKATKKKATKKKAAKRPASSAAAMRKRLAGYYKRRELGKASKLRAKMRRAGLKV